MNNNFKVRCLSYQQLFKATLLMSDKVLNVHMNKCLNLTGKKCCHNYNMQNPTVKRVYNSCIYASMKKIFSKIQHHAHQHNVNLFHICETFCARCELLLIVFGYA